MIMHCRWTQKVTGSILRAHATIPLYTHPAIHDPRGQVPIELRVRMQFSGCGVDGMPDRPAPQACRKIQIPASFNADYGVRHSTLRLSTYWFPCWLYVPLYATESSTLVHMRSSQGSSCRVAASRQECVVPSLPSKTQTFCSLFRVVRFHARQRQPENKKDANRDDSDERRSRAATEKSGLEEFQHQGMFREASVWRWGP
jgi:hypothetical protein